MGSVLEEEGGKVQCVSEDPQCLGTRAGTTAASELSSKRSFPRTALFTVLGGVLSLGEYSLCRRCARSERSPAGRSCRGCSSPPAGDGRLRDGCACCAGTHPGRRAAPSSGADAVVQSGTRLEAASGSFFCPLAKCDTLWSFPLRYESNVKGLGWIHGVPFAYWNISHFLDCCT